MRIAVFGGTGFVGGYLVDELLAHGHHPVLLVRPGSETRLKQGDCRTQIGGDIAEPGAVTAVISDADAVIYNIGILRQFPARGVAYEALHFEGAKRAMDAAEAAGVRRFLLMSANGVKAHGTGYQRTKYQAEQHLATTALEWTVFRPSVMFGDPRGQQEFATRLYRDVVQSLLPAPLFYDGLLPVQAGTFRLSPVHVKDVATAFVQALEMPATAGRILELCGPDALSWKEILQTIARACGTTKWALPASALFLKGLATVLEPYEFFPFTRDQLTMLLEGNTCNGEDAFRIFSLTPTPFDVQSLAYLCSAG